MKISISKVAASMLMLLGACSSNSDEYNETANEEFQVSDGAEERADETYAEFDNRRDELAGTKGEVAGFGCTEDCSGHDAGYKWAEERGITDPDDCGGKSWSFEEGCQAYANEHQGE
jgi:hypothetical protein